MVSSRAFALYFSASLFSCFDHFIGVFDYSLVGSMLSCYHGVQGKDAFYLTPRRRFNQSKTLFHFEFQNDSITLC